MTTSEIISFAAMIVALLMLILTGRRDTRGGASEQGEVKSTLRGIANGVDDIRVEQRAMRNDIVNLSVPGGEGGRKREIRPSQDRRTRNEDQ